jgi:histidyl-tRNA synthetase
MAVSTHKFQAPKGTRDFYPEDMALRRHIEHAWRTASIQHGFDEIEGPTFEHLELYTVKSGPGIVSELFSFRRSGGETDYALRPEFTPTLARMIAARGASLAPPVKWFAIPTHFRAERPQRGRLREFMQWNVDMVGLDDSRADTEVIAVAVRALESLGLTPRDVTVRISHRHVVSRILRRFGLSDEQLSGAFDLLDRRDKITEDQFAERAEAMGLEADTVARFDQVARTTLSAVQPIEELAAKFEIPHEDFDQLDELREQLIASSLADWCQYDLGIVRGLAYYTGTVFEVHEISGAERAIAGGGRYDQLIEMFGGPKLPACGFGMGDVVLGLVLQDRGLIDAELGGAAYLPRPDVFVISAGSEAAQRLMPGLVADLRRAGLHVRHSYRATKNVGKLLREADKARSRRVVILGDELDRGVVVIKDLDAQQQWDTPLDELHAQLTSGR